MTPEEIKRAKELCEKATAGPWDWSGGHLCAHGERIVDAPPNLATWGPLLQEQGANHSLIVESRDLLPKAIAEIERLKRLVKDIAGERIARAYGVMND